MKAQILKILNGNMTAKYYEKVLQCIPSGKTKKQVIHVGDMVELEENKYGDKYVVDKIYLRKNLLLRPPLANLDQLFIIISKTPAPDFLLVDKLIIYCLLNNIVPFIIINKSDIFTKEEIDDIVEQYKDTVNDIIVVSAKDGIGTDKVLSYLPDKLSAFTGQSAVGKSTLLNAINPQLNLQTNTLSKKTERGRHTTRHSEIFMLSNNILIADTPGFSLLDLEFDVKDNDLSEYYLDFEKYRNCKYSNCNHINLSDETCQVAKAVNSNLINRSRYDRYVEMYNKLYEKWRKKYD